MGPEMEIYVVIMGLDLDCVLVPPYTIGGATDVFGCLLSSIVTVLFMMRIADIAASPPISTPGLKRQN